MNKISQCLTPKQKEDFMQIGHHVAGNYDTQLQDTVKMENRKATENANQVKSSADISNLKEGAVFKGEILDIKGEKVTIALENRSELLARLQEGIELSVGDQLLFSVKENMNNQILIKPMFDSLYSAQTQVLEKALDMAGLSPTEKNFSAAKGLMEAGLPVDKGTLVKVLSQSMKFPETSMQTLVSLNKMNIPVTAENIAQYERYQSYHHQLTGDLTKTADSMAAFTDDFSADTSVKTLLGVADQIIEIFAGELGDTEALDGKTQGENVADWNAAGENIAAQNATSDIENEELQNLKNILYGTKGRSDGKNSEIHNEVEGKLLDAASDDESSLNPNQIAEKFGISKKNHMHLENALSKAGVSFEEVNQLFKQSNSPEDLLKNMLQALKHSTGSEAAIRSMLESNEFKDLFSDVIKKQWALNPKEMKDPKEIDELYNKILKQGKAFEDAVTSNGGEAKNFQQNFQNTRDNMQFMEQLNQQMIYAQMPLKLSNQNANSELYVYADKRKLMQKKDGISVMLHLDMDNLGMTDIKVTLTGTNVNARFYLNDQESVDIVAGNMNELAKQLLDRGFSLTNEVVKREPLESINQVVDEIIDENAERSIKRYTFDARM